LVELWDTKHIGYQCNKTQTVFPITTPLIINLLQTQDIEYLNKEVFNLYIVYDRLFYKPSFVTSELVIKSYLHTTFEMFRFAAVDGQMLVRYLF